MPLRPAAMRRRVTAVLVTATVAAGLLSGVLAAGPASADQPPNPSDSQLNSAKDAKVKLATEVGDLSAQVAEMQTQLQQLVAAQELAEQKLALALSELQQAQAAALTAQHNVAAAQDQVVTAQQEFNAYVAAVYISGSVDGTTGALLTAADPNVLLQRGTLEHYEATHQLDAIGDLSRATVTKSNADAAARLAVLRQQNATQVAAAAKTAADAAVRTAQNQQARLQSTLGAEQNRLQAAQLQLATLNNERSKFVAYQREQARLAAERAARARAAAEAAARERQNGGGPSGQNVPPGPIGNWTPAAGQIAVQRAERWLGTPYAWAGGNASGPTYGVCAGDGAFNDCHVIGFDCSGLAMYAWAQYPFAHYAATQYLQGSVHPNMNSLMPGDLVFWSSDGTVAGIHHVAIYIGNGNVIQAPESGSVIQITPLYDVDWGLFGATRPLT
jgi:cell wall-associated NlpC family hydrolase